MGEEQIEEGQKCWKAMRRRAPKRCLVRPGTMCEKI